MRLAANLREAVYLSALNGSLSVQRDGEDTKRYHSSFTEEEPFPIPKIGSGAVYPMSQPLQQIWLILKITQIIYKLLLTISRRKLAF